METVLNRTSHSSVLASIVLELWACATTYGKFTTGIEPRVSCMLDSMLPTELYPQPKVDDSSLSMWGGMEYDKITETVI